MTKAEVLDKFKVLIDKSADVSFGGYPAFIDSEIILFLEQAMKEVISNKFTGTLNQVGFEGNVKRISDLLGLICDTDLSDKDSDDPSEDSDDVSAVSDNTSNDSDDTFEENVKAFTLPTDFWFYVDSAIKIRKGGKLQKQHLELITHEESKRFVYTSTNKPWIPEPKCIVKGDSICVFYDPDLVDNIERLMLTYIFIPTLFVTSLPDSETEEDTLVLTETLYSQLEPIIDEIINRAVLIALENIESLRSQTKAELNSIQE